MNDGAPNEDAKVKRKCGEINSGGKAKQSKGCSDGCVLGRVLFTCGGGRLNLVITEVAGGEIQEVALESRL
jgi:hypothetical protein